MKYRKQMNKPDGKASGTGIFKHQNKRVNYRNQIDRMNNEIQRDNLNHNSLEHLQHQINQFKNLSFT